MSKKVSWRPLGRNRSSVTRFLVIISNIIFKQLSGKSASSTRCDASGGTDALSGTTKSHGCRAGITEVMPALHPWLLVVPDKASVPPLAALYGAGGKDTWATYGCRPECSSRFDIDRWTTWNRFVGAQSRTFSFVLLGLVIFGLFPWHVFGLFLLSVV
jgi:hypothetical protein